jgi:hypothetical protein
VNNIKWGLSEIDYTVSLGYEALERSFNCGNKPSCWTHNTNENNITLTNTGMHTKKTSQKKDSVKEYFTNKICLTSEHRDCISIL